MAKNASMVDTVIAMLCTQFGETWTTDEEANLRFSIEVDQPAGPLVRSSVHDGSPPLRGRAASLESARYHRSPGVRAFIASLRRRQPGAERRGSAWYGSTRTLVCEERLLR